MIRIEPISIERALEYSCGKAIERSSEAWEIYANDDLAFVAGVYQRSALGTAELWFILQPGFKRHARELLQVIPRLLSHLKLTYHNLAAIVDPAISVNQRFAEKFGFVFETSMVDVDGNNWLRYRLCKQHQ